MNTIENGDVPIRFLPESLLRAYWGAVELDSITYLDGGRITSELDLIKDLAVALRFPDYFDPNWDAVDECLADLVTGDVCRMCLCVTHANELWQTHAESAGKLVRAWLTATAHVSSDQEFHLLFVL